ncbi:MAG: arginase family protein [Veillonellales bacterium]
MKKVIVHTDDSLQRLTALLTAAQIDLRDLRDELQYFAQKNAIRKCRNRLFSPFSAAGVCRFLGSGDFHHLTLVILEELRTPFSLVVFDNHLDCSYRFPRYACGNWLYHAASLPNCKKILHVGSTEQYGFLRKVLSLNHLLRSGKLRVIPAVPAKNLAAYQAALNLAVNTLKMVNVPVYISIDKDVLTAEEAPGDWDNGIMTLPVLESNLAALADALDLIGVDITGEYSRRSKLTGHSIKRLLSDWDHPALREKMSASEALDCQSRVNLLLLEALKING